MPLMRAKLTVRSVENHGPNSETLSFAAVSGQFGKDGESEDNSYARWTPTANLSMSITNPALVGKFAVGDAFYVDFTKAE